MGHTTNKSQKISKIFPKTPKIRKSHRIDIVEGQEPQPPSFTTAKEKP